MLLILVLGFVFYGYFRKEKFEEINSEMCCFFGDDDE